MTRFIVIASGKGGAGKTTTAINLGTALTNFGREVIVMDANLTTPNIGVYLGAPVVPVTLHDVLGGKKHITEAAYLHPSGLKVIPGGISLDNLKKIDYKKLSEALMDLQDKAEVILIDIGPGLTKETLTILEMADEAIIVTNPELTAVTDALRTIKMMEKMNTRVIGIVLTRVRDDDYEMSPDNVEAILERPVIGIIPEDHNVRKSIHLKHPVVYTHPSSNAAMSYKRLAANLIGAKYEETLSKNDGFFIYVMRMVGLRK
jgi:septum site-determining protein MinD